MNYIDVKNFRKYEQLFGDNGPAKIGHVNAVIKGLNEAIANIPTGGLTGSNYVYVAADGTDVQNAAALQAAYVTAQGMSPSPTNRITIVAAPGYYNFGTTPFVMNTDCIDLVSLDGNRSIIFNAPYASPFYSSGTIILDFVSNVYVRGVDVQTKAFAVETYYPGVTIENCKGGQFSFSSSFFNMGSRFVDCEGGNNSFGGNTGNSYGTFIRCKAGSYSFGLTASGTFTDCTSAGYSFGYNGTANGTFTNCTSTGSLSFGGSYSSGTASGTFLNCKSVDVSFGLVASGTFTNCTAGNDSFGYYGTASGTFTNCVGSSSCFGYYGNASGNFYNCRGTFAAFGSGGTASGSFNSCVATSVSFGGGGGTLTGKLYYCRLTQSGQNFPTVSGGGITRLCITGSNVENNQG